MKKRILILSTSPYNLSVILKLFSNNSDAQGRKATIFYQILVKVSELVNDEQRNMKHKNSIYD